MQVEPELRAGAEIVGEAQGGFGAEAALACQDLADAVGRDVDEAGQGGSAQPQLGEFVGEDLARMDRCACHARPLVVVDDLDVVGSFGVLGPAKTEPPLRVDADAELAGPVTAQRLEAVARQLAQIDEAGRSVQHAQPPFRLGAKALETRHPFATGEPLGCFVLEAADRGVGCASGR